MNKQATPATTQLLVRSPLQTKDVMMALRDWEPMEGLRFTLLRRRSYLLLFEASTPNGYLARELALKRLEEKELDQLPDLDVQVV